MKVDGEGQWEYTEKLIEDVHCCKQKSCGTVWKGKREANLNEFFNFLEALGILLQEKGWLMCWPAVECPLSPEGGD